MMIRLAASIAVALVAIAPAAPQQPAPSTKSLQGNRANAAWKSDPYLQALYHITLGAFAKGADKIDTVSHQETFFAILRAKAVVTGADPDGMIKHMKAIPMQMVEIVKRDPKTLDTYDNFVVALVGPT